MPAPIARETPGSPQTRATDRLPLVDQCSEANDSPAWHELVDRYGHYLESGVYRALARFGMRPTHDLVEDLVQEAYCRLLEAGGRRLRTFRGTVPAELGAWLLTLAYRTAVDRLRCEWADKRGRDLLFPQTAMEEQPTDPAFCPERRTEVRERLRDFLRRCRAAAGDRESARVLTLVLVAGCSSREAARAHRGQMSPTGVDTLVHRLRRRLAGEGLRLAARRAG